MIVKCLVWDLDDTLWDGVLAESDEVVLKPAAIELLTCLDRRGILHSVASRNDRDIASAKLEALGIADYFLFPQFGWGPKSGSVRTVAEHLRFDLAAMAFVDDNPVELAEVSRKLPSVRCYRHDEIAALAGLPEFTPAVITEESARRRGSYLAASRRETSRTEFDGTDADFVRDLDVVMKIAVAEPADLDRVAELTARTTQMNATGVVHTHEDLRAILADGSADILIAEVTDRFGAYGKAGVVVVTRRPGVWHLRLVATSCRLVPIGAGAALLNWLSGAARADGAHLVGDFRRTGRNRLMEIAYRFAGFTDDWPSLTCACHELLPAGAPGTRLHLAPGERTAESGISIEATWPPAADEIRKGAADARPEAGSAE
ncbi:hypothetical protein CFP71_02945 [Amycolatopsis thailandensis]|uniref:HAD-IIIC family phosphatase n=1 Tax=Amycolatopsis thailandensis TaxID=589330 RepID=A0A229SI20_9PSEU|nr:HAD-IIIC family phosphatase [Amycolatopsis thailandensis]OXM58513.1 hypothetical protein CFP71_02945 [Amycolatopsis thailandensis]